MKKHRLKIEKLLAETDFCEKWEKTRVQGTFHYVFIHGVLGWGLGFGLIWWLWKYLFASLFSTAEYLFETNRLLIHFGSFLIAGFVTGILIWFVKESAYQKSLNNKDFNIWIPKQKSDLK